MIKFVLVFLSNFLGTVQLASALINQHNNQTVTNFDAPIIIKTTGIGEAYGIGLPKPMLFFLSYKNSPDSPMKPSDKTQSK